MRGCAQEVVDDCWERGRPVRTEREARKTLVVFDVGNNAPRTVCGRDVRVPSVARPRAPQGWTFLARPRCGALYRPVRERFINALGALPNGRAHAGIDLVQHLDFVDQAAPASSVTAIACSISARKAAVFPTVTFVTPLTFSKPQAVE